MKNYIYSAIVILATSSCGIQKMQDNMDDMAARTKKLESLTEQLSGLTRDLREMTLWAMNDLRQGNATDMRDKMLTTMNAQASVEAKLSSAAKYLMAFEFQMWRGKYVDDKKRLEDLYSKAVQEFFLDLERNIDGADLDTSVTGTSNRKKNLYALAGALHVVNPNQYYLGNVGEPSSMLAILLEGLRRRDESPRGRPEYLNDIAAKADKALYLLQLRVNFLGAVPLNMLTDIRTGNEFSQFWKGVTKVFFTWEPNFTDTNPSQVALATKWMEESIQARLALVGMGASLKPDSTIVTIYQKMDAAAVRAKHSRTSPKDAAPKDLEISCFLTTLQRWLN